MNERGRERGRKGERERERDCMSAEMETEMRRGGVVWLVKPREMLFTGTRLNGVWV